jgi:hypothetical protein
MANYKNYNENIMKIIGMVLDNQVLCKYLYVDTESPQSSTPITNTSELIMKRIFPLPKTVEAITDKMSILNIYFPTSEKYKVNSGFKEVILYFDIMSHLDIWMIDEGIRVYSIMNEIDKMFNNIYISKLSMNRILFEKDSIMKFSDYFYGYRLCYRLSQSSNVGCDS